jgi:hypothetical protein
MRKWKCGGLLAVLLVVSGGSGCSALDKAYKQEVRWTNVPAVQVQTNMVVVTKAAPGAVGGVAIETNFVPVFYTNFVHVPVTNLVARPEALAAIEATGSIVNAFMPGIGSAAALALGGLYHLYRQVRNRKVVATLVQGVETARAVLGTTPQGQAADALLVKWLMEHQKEAGVFTAVSGLVERLSDNPAARVTAQDIAERVQLANRLRGTTEAALPGGR